MDDTPEEISLAAKKLLDRPFWRVVGKIFKEKHSGKIEMEGSGGKEIQEQIESIQKSLTEANEKLKELKGWHELALEERQTVIGLRSELLVLKVELGKEKTKNSKLKF